MGHMGHSVQLHLEWHGDLLLHLLRRVAGPLRNHLCIGVRDIGIGLDGQVMEGNSTPNEQRFRRAKSISDRIISLALTPSSKIRVRWR